MNDDTVTCDRCLKETDEATRCEGCNCFFCPECWEIHVVNCEEDE